MLSIYSVYAEERRGLIVGIFLTAFLSTLALTAAFAFWDLGGALAAELRDLLGLGRYVIMSQEGAGLTWADVAKAAAAVCSDRSYGVTYLPLKIAYLNGTERWVTAAFLPRWAMEGIALLEVAASQALAREGDMLYAYISGKPLLVTVARALRGQIYVPGLSADLYLDSDLIGASHFNVIVVEKGSCGSVEDLRALFPGAVVLDTDALLTAFWGQLLIYLAGAAVVAASATAAVAAMSYALATSALQAHWKDFAIMRVLGMRKRQLLALAALLFYTPALSGVVAAAFLAGGLEGEGLGGMAYSAIQAAAVVGASSALPLFPAFRRLYSMHPVEALRHE